MGEKNKEQYIVSRGKGFPVLRGLTAAVSVLLLRRMVLEQVFKICTRSSSLGWRRGQVQRAGRTAHIGLSCSMMGRRFVRRCAGRAGARSRADVALRLGTKAWKIRGREMHAGVAASGGTPRGIVPGWEIAGAPIPACVRSCGWGKEETAARAWDLGRSRIRMATAFVTA